MNKIQSKTADFVASAATWRTGRNIRVVLDSGPFPPLCENMTSSTNWKYITFYIAVREELSHVTGNMYRKFGENWTCGGF